MDDVRVVDEDQSLHHLDNKPGRFIIRLGKSGSTRAMEKKKDSTINLLHFSSVRSYTEEPTFEKSSPPCTDSISSRKACTSQSIPADTPRPRDYVPSSRNSRTWSPPASPPSARRESRPHVAPIERDMMIQNIHRVLF